MTLLMEFIGTLDASFKKCQSEAGEMPGFKQLTLSQLAYIDAIHALETPTLSAIALRLNFSKASVTLSVNKLVQLGYLSKIQSPSDRRVYHVSLTEPARQLVRVREEALQSYVALIDSALDASESRQFEVLLSKVISRFKAETP